MPRKPPNIILIVCDTLGAKHMSLYGYHRKTTPMLERLVEEDGFTVYNRCFSPAPWTTPAHASLFTGLYPSEHKVNSENFYLGRNFTTLAEMLNLSGYYTIGFSNNYLISKVFGFDRGFNEFHEWQTPYCNDFLRLSRMIATANRGKYLFKFKVLAQEALKTKEFSKMGEFLVQKLIWRFHSVLNDSTPFTRKSIKRAKHKVKELSISNKRFFMFINLMQTHGNYNPPKGYRRKYLPTEGKDIINLGKCVEDNYIFNKKHPKSIDYWKARYDEEVLFLDSQLYSFYNDLKKAGKLDNTVFIITSDHGELFGEMGHYEHHWNVYNSLVHIPLLVKYPWDAGAKTENQLVQLQDIYALLSEVSNSSLPVPNSSISSISGFRRNVICQDIGRGYSLDNFLKKYPQWNYKDYDLAYPASSFMAEIEHMAHKVIYRSNNKWEFYKLSKSLYEEENKDNFVSNDIEKILREKLSESNKELGFKEAVPED